ncbi:hypothetical protein PBY51_024233 [Eleginops maclovinus]|uniref:Uncharacterized protein n=1 Tax=Eleginops maclovinus TaxID=56733 RepID=A0AAN7XZF6_ELEMC|nr:hypothetical protein PBY51_024233 [Eleginops maclovinus]
MLGRVMHSNSTAKAMKKNAKIISSLTCESNKATEKTCSSCPQVFTPLRLGPFLVVFPSRARELLARAGRQAVRHRSTDRTLPRHCNIRGASHVTLLDAHAAFM